MSEELNPITREEMFLAGNTELTPVTRMEMFLAKIAAGGGSGGGGVSSWNDLTDKPFFDEDGYLLPETTATFEPMEEIDGMPGLMYETKAAPKNLENYTVKYAGAKYICKAVEVDLGVFMFGNQLMMGGEDSGEPFAVIVNANGNLLLFFPLDGATSGTVSIYGRLYKPLDPVFLAPDAFYPGVIDLYSINSTAFDKFGTTFNASVDADTVAAIISTLKRGVVGVFVGAAANNVTGPMHLYMNVHYDGSLEYYFLESALFGTNVIFRIGTDGTIKGGYIIDGKMPW